MLSSRLSKPGLHSEAAGGRNGPWLLLVPWDAAAHPANPTAGKLTLWCSHVGKDGPVYTQVNWMAGARASGWDLHSRTSTERYQVVMGWDTATDRKQWKPGNRAGTPGQHSVWQWLRVSWSCVLMLNRHIPLSHQINRVYIFLNLRNFKGVEKVACPC